MTLTLYNTLTRRKEPFEPLDRSNVRMYVCGPTVYDFAHIGNARPVIVFDVLFRLLRHIYGPGHVTYARNITDVDDKINARAAEQGVPIRQLTERTAKQFHEDIAALGVLPPTVEPRATDYVRRTDGALDMITLIQRLMARGNAYAAEGHVLFDVRSMKNKDGALEYGKLSGRSLEEMEAGARVEVAPYKKDPMDFVLWKPSKPGEPAWEGPWGPGRPGWHIECSAMSGALLGETFDIHGGGIDLVFPHHENEIAQSRCAHGTPVMARFWMHNGFLQVEGEKMAKSLGNFVTIRELLTTWHEYAWPGEALRFNMLRTHYRQPLDWTLSGLDEAHRLLWDWYDSFADIEPSPGVPDRVLRALSDDLNTPGVISQLHALMRDGDRSGLLSALRFLGFSGKRERIPRIASAVGVAKGAAQVVGVGTTKEIDLIVARIAERNAARKRKDFKEADRIRDELDAMGIALKDGKDPATGEPVTTWEVKR